MATSTGACGTNGGAQRHRRAGEKPCQPCLDAANAYQQQWRNRGGSREPARRYQRAVHRAVQRLVAAHQYEYADLLREERARELDEQTATEIREWSA